MSKIHMYLNSTIPHYCNAPIKLNSKDNYFYTCCFEEQTRWSDVTCKNCLKLKPKKKRNEKRK